MSAMALLLSTLTTLRVLNTLSELNARLFCTNTSILSFIAEIKLSFLDADSENIILKTVITLFLTFLSSTKEIISNSEFNALLTITSDKKDWGEAIEFSRNFTHDMTS